MPSIRHSTVPTTATHDLPIEDLVAYLDGELADDRRQQVEAHLRCCPSCRARLEEFEQVGRLLRERLPVADNPSRRVTLLARVEAELHSHPHARERRGPPRMLLVMLSLVALVLAAFTLAPSGSEAGFRLQRFVRDIVVLPVGSADPTPPPSRTAGPPFRPVRLSGLPAGLSLVGCSAPNPDRLDCRYRNDEADLTILLVQSRSSATRSMVPPTEATLMVVDGLEVLWQAGTWPKSVDRLLWEQQGMVFDAIALHARAPGLSTRDAQGIAAALITARNAEE